MFRSILLGSLGALPRAIANKRLEINLRQVPIVQLGVKDVK